MPVGADAPRRRDASGSGSPSMTAMMRSIAAEMPPEKSPLRKRGTMTWSVMRLAMHVRQRAFQSVADFDAHGAIVLRDQQQHAVIDALRPSFQPSATRIEYCSIVSGCVVGTISTAIWLPLAASNSRKRCSSAAICSGVSVPVRSVTGERSGGTATCANAAAHSKTSAGAAPHACYEPLAIRVRRLLIPAFGLLRLRWRRRLRAELDRRRPRDRRFVLDREIRLGLVAEHFRSQVRRERAHRHVVRFCTVSM